MKRLAILGATGSIGTQTLQVVDAFPGEFEVTILAGHSNWQLLLQQAEKYHPQCMIVTEPAAYEKLKQENRNPGCTVLCGMQGVLQALDTYPVDMLVGAMSGAAGIEPTLKALEMGIDLALANKETLVAGGDLVRKAQQKSGAKILPVDSEHSAIFQCIEPDSKCLNKILLTASGGPFRTWDKEALYQVTPAQALKHPNWSMGQKITIDSATLMNKGLEVIEANWLFGVDYDNIQVLVHPQSIIHSMVEYGDGTVLAHLGKADMRIPIQYALTYPERWQSDVPRLDLFATHQLTFEEPDLQRFPNLRLAYEAIAKGGNMPCILNAANEVVNLAFREGKCGFLQMSEVIAETMAKTSFILEPTYEDYVQTDRLARQIAKERINN